MKNKGGNVKQSKLGLGLLPALLLAGCDMSDSKICGSLPMRLSHTAQTADDQKQVLYSCMERWAARLARSKESPDVVARAAFAACEDALVYYQAALAREKLPDTPESNADFWLRRSLFIAVQTRAGDCYKDA